LAFKKIRRIGTLGLNFSKFNPNVPMRRIFLNANRPGASLGFLFRIFWMEPIRRTSGDYSLPCNTLPRLDRW
jgi:hypothetical protein